MVVTQHARDRLATRFGAEWASSVSAIIETWDGERGIVAYILADIPSPDGSTGELLIIVANEGSIETAYFRRSEQDISPAYFGARKVVDKRVYPLHHFYP